MGELDNLLHAAPVSMPVVNDGSGHRVEMTVSATSERVDIVVAQMCTIEGFSEIAFARVKRCGGIVL
jgi:hypothetical protein